MPYGSKRRSENPDRMCVPRPSICFEATRTILLHAARGSFKLYSVMEVGDDGRSEGATAELSSGAIVSLKTCATSAGMFICQVSWRPVSVLVWAHVASVMVLRMS